MSGVRQEELPRIMNTKSPAFMEQSQPAIFALFSRPRVVIEPMAHLICAAAVKVWTFIGL
ncbi:hypothetical protein N7465_007244 [Penicillium sp. CMV-2018d]|nr:hypothetical protein N7465_007244 [Penicillium sp. CMV-2018d]